MDRHTDKKDLKLYIPNHSISGHKNSTLRYVYLFWLRKLSLFIIIISKLGSHICF